jgi:hypothetical protein
VKAGTPVGEIHPASSKALLMLADSAAVIGIGVLIFPILKRHHETTAYGYLSAQVAQGLMLAVGIAFLLLPILGHNTGVPLSIPGGLFEIAFSVLLITKGFPEGQSHGAGWGVPCPSERR